MIDICELFQLKKKKLEQMLTKIRSELHKFESRLEEVKRKQKEASENRDVVMADINGHFDKIIATLKIYQDKLLRDAEEKAKVGLHLLTGQETILQSVVQNLQEYVANIQSENIHEKIAFIFYTMSAVDVSMPEVCSSISYPGNLKYRGGIFPEKHCRKLLGLVIRNTENIKLRKNERLEVTRVVKLAKGEIVSLVYSLISETFWAFANEEDAFIKCDEKGYVQNKICVNILQTPNKPICIVDYDEYLLYRNDSSNIFMLQGSQRKLFIDVTPMWVTCLCVTNSGEVLAGLMHSITTCYTIARFNLSGECQQCISHLMKNWTLEPFPSGNVIRAYIAENINGVICLSFDSSNSKSVILINPNGNHKLTYNGAGSFISRPFLPRGICTDILGHILIADENNHGIHVLNKEGVFLTMLTIPSEPKTVPISLCVDKNDNICVGCADGKVRVLKYFD